MPVTEVMQISALKCTESIWRPGFARTHWGSLQRPPDLAGFKSGGRNKGRRKGEGGNRQLREGGRNEERAGRREGTEESVRRMEAEISQGPAWAPKGTPGKMRHRNSLGEISKLGWGQSLKLVS